MSSNNLRSLFKLSSIGDRISFLMKSAKISLHELSINTKVPSPTLHRLINDPNCNPTLASLVPVAKFFQISIGDLIDGPLPESTGWYVQDKSGWAGVPLIEPNCFSSIEQFKQKLLDTAENEFIKTDAEVGPDCFAVKMYDQSMTPTFPQGALLIFDPREPCSDGAYVLVFIEHLAAFLFKQIFFDGPIRFVGSTANQIGNVAPIKLTPQDVVMGTLVQATLSF